MNNKASKNDKSNLVPPRLVVAVYDEDFAHVLADFVEHHDWPDKTQIHLLYVVEEPSIRRVLRCSPDIAQQIIDENDVFGNRLVRDIKKRLAKAIPHAIVEGSVETGVATEEILKKAANVSANYIVIGSHGRLGLGSMVLGSVSLGVMMEAGCSVLVVRHPATKAIHKSDAVLTNKDLPKQMATYCES